MPKSKQSRIVNKATGKDYPVTEAQLKAIQANPMTKGLYNYKEVEEPEEVTKLRSSQASANSQNTDDEDKS